MRQATGLLSLCQWMERALGQVHEATSAPLGSRDFMLLLDEPT